MRLLDLIAQSSPSQSGLPPNWRLPAPHDFAEAARACPLRLVLADDVVRCTTALAYAEGDRLIGCLDLLRVPSERLWVEWAEAPRQEVLCEIPALEMKPTAQAGRAGVLIHSDASGRTGNIRTFWSTPEDRIYSGAMITHFDLGFPIRRATRVADVFSGESAGVSLPEEPAIDALLSHIHFRFDPAWAHYYRSAALSRSQRSALGSRRLAVYSFRLTHAFRFVFVDVGKGRRRAACR
jgi:hypothetical protein